MNSSYDKVIFAFDARPVGNGAFWKGRCPRPSCSEKPRRTLMIWIGNNGQLMICCWRCGRMFGEERKNFLKDILSSKGLTMMDLFPDRDEKERLGGARPVPVETYVYEDIAGNPSHRTVRYEPKTFHQDRWDSARQRWIPGLGPWPENPRYLFRLKELIRRDRRDETCFIVEGERCVMALENLGFLATCNVGGTGMGWLDDYSTFLVGRHCVILPDNDLPGYRHADSVLGNLVRHGAASVRLLKLPGLKNKEDVVNWINRGGSRESLLALLELTPRWKPS